MEFKDSKNRGINIKKEGFVIKGIKVNGKWGLEIKVIIIKCIE